MKQLALLLLLLLVTVVVVVVVVVMKLLLLNLTVQPQDPAGPARIAKPQPQPPAAPSQVLHPLNNIFECMSQPDRTPNKCFVIHTELTFSYLVFLSQCGALRS